MAVEFRSERSRRSRRSRPRVGGAIASHRARYQPEWQCPLEWFEIPPSPGPQPAQVKDEFRLRDTRGEAWRTWSA